MIPSSSQVLIISVSPASLILAVALARLGIEVLIADDEAYTSTSEIISLEDNSDLEFLKYLGFEFADKNPKSLDLKQIEKQALKLLANSLCNILWNTKIKKTESFPGKFMVTLENKGNTIIQTALIVAKNDIELGYFESSIKNARILFWKIQGYIEGFMAAKTLNHHHQEKEIISNYFSRDDLSKSVFHKLFNRFLNVEKGVLNLRDSQINLHLSQFRKVNAGDLLPDLKLYDEKLKQETSLYNWCKFGNFSLVVLGDVASYNLTQYANWVKSNYKLEIFYLPFTEKNTSVFDFFEVIKGEVKTVIVRPDKYIGFINDRVELEIIENYLNNVLFMYPTVKAFTPRALKE